MTFENQQAMALLMLLTSVDPRHAVADELTARGKAETWAKLLNMSGVDPQWARSYVERSYREPRPQALTLGDICRAWSNVRRVEESKERVTVLPGFTQLGKRPEWFDQFKAECDAVRSAGGDPEGVPLHAQLLKLDETRERRCVNHDKCVCTHTECRDGWLDQGTTVTSEHGTKYPAVRRCPMCFDVVLMQSELKPRRRARA